MQHLIAIAPHFYFTDFSYVESLEKLSSPLLPVYSTAQMKTHNENLQNEKPYIKRQETLRTSEKEEENEIVKKMVR